ncbi:MAG TPA: ComF family protein [Rudaea sp.]
MRPFWVDRRWRALPLAVLPARCLLCGSDGDGRDLCVACAADLRRNDVCCIRCALPLSYPAPLCGECLQHPPPFDAAFVPYIYADPLDFLTTRLKFGRDLAAGRVLADLWTQALDERTVARPDLLVAIPLHASRLRERGFNQALELARPLAQRLAIPMSARALRRTRATPAQTGLSADQRRRNLRGAFAVSADESMPAHVAIVDDVMTTGTTLREAARVLKRAGAVRVDVWALARAPLPGRR